MSKNKKSQNPIVIVGIWDFFIAFLFFKNLNYF